MAMDSLGERLEWAVTTRLGGNLSRFQEGMVKELAGTAVQGATYPAIKRYLRDETTPSLEFVQHAARLLSVRAAWLGFGDGLPTSEDEESRDAEIARAAVVSFRERGTDELLPEDVQRDLTLDQRISVAGQETLIPGGPVVRRAFYRVLRLVAEAAHRPLTEEDILRVARRMSRGIIRLYSDIQMGAAYPSSGATFRLSQPFRPDQRFEGFALTVLGALVPHGLHGKEASPVPEALGDGSV